MVRLTRSRNTPERAERRIYSAEPALTMSHHVHDETRDSGFKILGDGFRLYDRNGRMAHDSATAFNAGILITMVSGVTQSHADLRSVAFTPGRRGRIRPPEPGGLSPAACDRCAKCRPNDWGGWIPSNLATELAPVIDSGDPRHAFVFWQGPNRYNERTLGDQRADSASTHCRLPIGSSEVRGTDSPTCMWVAGAFPEWSLVAAARADPQFSRLDSFYLTGRLLRLLALAHRCC